jgi:hypothetical protein
MHKPLASTFSGVMSPKPVVVIVIQLKYIKWRERMAGKKPPPSHSSMEEIDVAITFTVPGSRRIVHHERIMALVDHRNHTMQQ